ncbi:DUF58 domain-containing protein [Comamonas kerstersii]|uniref:DUF58 domain-containing protein n=1 Tax=Comamonas kerstersii TaxID=225992 RepID=UPI000E8C3AA3|nr:DUF58 domain-containing protein [Comamonas kerstersii]
MPHAPHPTRSRWRQTLHDWAARRQRPHPLHTLQQRNIYVMPSAAGWALAATLMVLLVASINFQLNLGYALTFLIAGSALASLWMGHRNLRGLQLRLDSLQPVFQGERAHIPVLLQIHQGQRARHGLSLALDRLHGPLAWAHTDVAPGQTARVELGSVPHLRGWHQVPRILLESRFPLGVFRLWSYWQPDDRVLVYPAPETPMPPVRFGQANAHGCAPMQHSGSSEFDGVRSYQRGDAMRQVVWKKAATALASGSGELVVRDSARTSTHTLWLAAHATGLHDPEAQIARLTAWVLFAHAQQWHWGLVLPSGQRIAPAGGSAHLHTCLAALAVDGQPAATPISSV